MYFQLAAKHAIYPSETIGDDSYPEHCNPLILMGTQNQPKTPYSHSIVSGPSK